MKKNILIVLILGAFGTGCAHTHKVLNAESKTQSAASEVHVEIGTDEVKEGETVDVFTRNCTTDNRPGIKGHRSHSCKMDKVGEAVVAKVVSEKTVAVAPLNNLVIDPKMYVEKKK
jgi:hypothetical protein